MTLAKGKNVLKATVTAGSEELTDEITWNYSGEHKREVDSQENKKEHAGG